MELLTNEKLRTWDMRDNWMDLEDFNSGDILIEIDHSLTLYLTDLSIYQETTIEKRQSNVDGSSLKSY